MNRRDLSVALFLLDRIDAPLTDPNRLELERLLLGAAVEMDRKEREVTERRRRARAN